MTVREIAHHAAKPPSRRAARLGLATLAALVLVAWAVAFSSVRTIPASAAADPTRDTLTVLQERLAACRVDLASATSTGQRSRAQQCINDTNRSIAWLLGQSPTPGPTGTPSPTSSPTPSPTVSPTPAPTTPSPTPAPTTPGPSPTTTPSPTPSPSPTSSWPGPGNTGVPAGTTLTVYTGPCTITVANTIIDAKLVSCDLDIATTGVTITRSSIGGVVSIDSAGGSTLRLSISNSVIDAGHREATGLSDGLFDAQRVEVRGGNRGVYCAWWCSLRDSWVHGTYVESDWHASGVRAERYSTIVHNSIACDWLVPTQPGDGGCSADLTGYPDFAPTHDWLIENNLFVANPCAGCPVGPASDPNGAAFCAYGGSSPGKPFSGDPLTGTNIVFRDNLFQRGATSKCAAYGPIDSFNASKPGAVWSGNRYDDGVAVLP